MTAETVAAPSRAKRTPRIQRRGILLLGVIVIPFLLSLALNNYGALTVDGAIRMAFATVAGQTVAILSALVAVGITVQRRESWASVAAFAILAVLVVVAAISSMIGAGDLLLTRLDLVIRVDLMNG